MSHSHAHPHAHDLGLLIGGVDLFAALIEAVDAAHHEVHLETYIFRFEGAGADVAHALMRAAQRGVQVRVVVDGVGTGEPPALGPSSAVDCLFFLRRTGGRFGL